MEKKYNKQELDNKIIPQLRDILKNMGLKVSGKKEELIDRILTNQPKEQSTIGGDYISLLPKDITNMVQQYRIENNPNNLMIKNLLDDININLKISIITHKKELEKIGVPVNIIVQPKDEDYGVKIDYSNLPLISDRTAGDFLYFLVQNGVPEELLNYKLKKYDTEYRIIIFSKPGYKNATDFDIMKVKYI